MRTTCCFVLLITGLFLISSCQEETVDYPYDAAVKLGLVNADKILGEWRFVERKEYHFISGQKISVSAPSPILGIVKFRKLNADQFFVSNLFGTEVGVSFRGDELIHQNGVTRYKIAKLDEVDLILATYELVDKDYFVEVTLTLKRVEPVLPEPINPG